jgi:uncharacterized membrane protein YidH (DUF202 family)
MKRIIYSATSAAMLAAPFTSFAAFQASGGQVGTLLTNILGFANSVLIPFIIGIGFLVFVWGMFKYFIAGGADSGKQEEGKSLMIYATLGFVLIVVFWGVVNLLVNGIGLGGETLQNIPKG